MGRPRLTEENYVAAFEARFDASVDQNGPTPDLAVYGDIGPCWVWTGHRNDHGYGVISRRTQAGGKSTSLLRAHRVAWEREHGALPAEVLVLHKCDNPACVRVSHLTTGTHQINTDHKMQRGRHRVLSGDAWHQANGPQPKGDAWKASHPNWKPPPRNPHLVGTARTGAKLTDDDVRAIRASTDFHRVLAARYGVSEAVINGIRKGTRWKHVPGPPARTGRRAATSVPEELMATIGQSDEPIAVLMERHGISKSTVLRFRRMFGGLDYSRLRGEGRYNAKLTNEDVLAIRQSRESTSVLAARYGVTRAAIRAVQVGASWRHVEPSPEGDGL